MLAATGGDKTRFRFEPLNLGPRHHVAEEDVSHSPALFNRIIRTRFMVDQPVSLDKASISNFKASYSLTFRLRKRPVRDVFSAIPVGVRT